MTEEPTIVTRLTGLHWNWGWVGVWTGLFAFNLFTPLMFSSHYPPSCLLGIALGIVTCWFFGLTFQYFSDSFREHLVIGSLFLGCMQFGPLLQLLAGMAAIASTNALTGLQLNSNDASGALAGFIVTIITGQILLAFALAIPVPFKLYAACVKKTKAIKCVEPELNQPVSHEVNKLEGNQPARIASEA